MGVIQYDICTSKLERMNQLDDSKFMLKERNKISSSFTDNTVIIKY